jgi:tetratricopeptide (TPR) repeat protein
MTPRLSGIRKPRPFTLAVALAVVALLAAAGWQGWIEYNLRAARRLADRRDFPAALDHLGRCRFAWPRGDEVLFLTARTTRRAGRHDQAEELLAACKARGYDPEAITLELALLRAQEGELRHVEAYLHERLDRNDADAPFILEALAQGYLRTFRLPEAVDCLDRWLERDPDAVQALVWRAEADQRLHRTTRAIEDYRRAVALDPGRRDARLRLGGLLLEASVPREALEHFERLAAEQPDDPAVLLGLARCRRAVGEPERALPLLEKLLAERPRDAGALCERGRLEIDAHRPAEAETWLRKAVEAAPYEEETVYNLMLCLQDQGKRDEAAKWRARLDAIGADLQRLSAVVRQIPDAPHDADLRRRAGEILLRNGHEEEGLRWLNSALEQDPGHRATHQALADYYEQRGQDEEAARHRKLAGAP